MFSVATGMSTGSVGVPASSYDEKTALPSVPGSPSVVTGFTSGGTFHADLTPALSIDGYSASSFANLLTAARGKMIFSLVNVVVGASNNSVSFTRSFSGYISHVKCYPMAVANMLAC